MGWRLVCALSVACLVACGSGDRVQQSVGPAAPTIAITPTTVTLAPQAQQRFTATTTGTSQSPTWSVVEGAGGGNISADGNYTAPSAAGVYHVTASVPSDPSINATATVTVTAASAISITITPASVLLQTGATQTFTATVTGATNTGVRWSVQENDGGQVDDHGRYVAPSSPGTFHVAATSVADPTQSALATVTVQPMPPNITISITPAAASLQVGTQQQFAATITGTSDQRVLWSIVEARDSGTITADGFYTAPAGAGVFHVAAAPAIDSTKSATATVTVTTQPPPPPPPDISISVSPSTVSLLVGGKYQFTATVTGTTDQGVIWSVQEGVAGGTIDTSGNYLAPSSNGTYHVVATSHADGTKTATSTVTVTAVPVVAIAIAPGSASLTTGGSAQFTATVTGTADVGVLWSVKEGTSGGSVDATGKYVAPTTAGTFHVVATSHADPTKTATATVTVSALANTITVSINPSSVVMPVGASVQFSAVVTGTSDTAVAWTADGGSIDASGKYTAPSRLDNFHVVATSHADPSKSASAAVTLFTTATGDFIDHGGAVVPKTRTFAAWWGDFSTLPADVPTVVHRLLQGLDGSAYLGIADEYMRGAHAATTFAGDLYDSGPLTNDVGKEVCHMLAAGGVTPQAGDMVFLLSAVRPQGYTYCANHTTAICQGTTVLFAFVSTPYGRDGCAITDGCSATGFSPEATAFGGWSAHEFMEAITDPDVGQSWTDDNGSEIADRCESEWYRECVPLSTGSLWIQGEYSNAAHACVSK